MLQLFVADLHLKPERPDLSRAFLHFLQHHASTAQQLYLLGDIFEAWIGDDAPPPDCGPILRALTQLSNTGVEIFFQHGNRDFLISHTFANDVGCTLLPEQAKIQLSSQQTAVLIHGDQLCTDDHAYIKFREMVRNPSWQSQFLAKSVTERIKIAQHLRDQSQQANSEKSAQIMDINVDALSHLLQNNPCQVLIHGHTHRPQIHQHVFEQQACTRVVLGDWDESGWYLSCNENGFELIDFPLKNIC